MGAYLFCIRPQLLAYRARLGAFLLAGSVAACTPVVVALTRLAITPPFAVPLLLLSLLAIWSVPERLVRLTGGSSPLPEHVQRVLSSVTKSWEQFEIGDLDAARHEIQPLVGTQPPATARYVDLWQRFLDEEVARRVGSRESSQATIREVTEEAVRLTRPSRRLSGWVLSILLVLASVIGAAPAAAYARACVAVEFLLPAQAIDGPAQASSLGASLLTSPSPEAALQLDESVDIDAAAESRSDPHTRAQLLADGFVAGHQREWRAADGRMIDASVFEFRDPAGALEYQRSVNRYACRFSNDAFRGAGDAVGLQVRYSRGEPIVEQVSWVIGSRRFVVSVGALAPPDGHERVLRLAQLQQEQALH